MKKLILIIIVIGLVAAFTNPTMDDYIAWYKNELAQKTTSGIERAFTNFVSGTVIENVSKRSDKVVLSIFATDILDSHTKVLGIFKKFIPISNVETSPKN